MEFSSPLYVYLQVCRECEGCSLDCYAAPDGSALTLKEAKSIVDILVESKVFTVLLDGGEPLLWEGIVELVEYMKKNPLVVAVLSDGRELSQVDSLRQAELDMIQIPLEGPAQYHDAIRGEGAFEQCLRAITTFCDAGITTHVGTVVTPSNLQYVEQISEILSSFPVRVHRIGRYIHPTDYLDPEQCLDLFSRVKILNEKKRLIMPNNCYTFVKHTPYGEKVDFRKFQGCVGGKTSAAITCEGYVVPCPHFASRKIAESIDAPVIWDVDLKTIWKDWDFLKEFRRGLKDCQDCPSAVECGGCRAAAFSGSGLLDTDPGCPLQRGNVG